MSIAEIRGGKRSIAEKGKRNAEYVGGESGGIPEGVFQPGVTGEIVGKTGKTHFECKTTEAFVGVRDLDDETRWFVAGVVRGDTLMLSVYNKGKNGERNPDLYPAKLTKRSVEYFTEQGYELSHIDAHWEGDNCDNLRQYREGLAKAEPAITEKDKRDSAKGTWTGGIATELGFPQVDSVTETEKGVVLTTFSKRLN